MRGRLDAYNEQGWEGFFVCAFLPDEYDRNDGPRFLTNGDHLSIFDEAGQVLWQAPPHIHQGDPAAARWGRPRRGLRFPSTTFQPLT